MSWWPFKASNYVGKISKAKKGHSKVSKGQSKSITIVIYDICDFLIRMDLRD